MKRLFAVLAACMTITCAFASCGKNSQSESTKQAEETTAAADTTTEEAAEETTEAATEEETTEAETTAASDEDDEAADLISGLEEELEDLEDEGSGEVAGEFADSYSNISKIVSDSYKGSDDITGVWYSDEMECALSFTDSKVLGIMVDISEEMWYDEKGVVHFVGQDDESMADYCKYDGSTLQFLIDVDDVESDMMTLKRKGDADPNSAYGMYEMVSGMFYDQQVANYSALAESPEIDAILGNESLIILINVGSYTIDGSRVVFDKDAAAMLELSEEDAYMDFEVKGNTLTLDDGGDVITLSKVN